MPTHNFHAGTSLDLRAYRAFPSATTTRSSSLRAPLHAFHSLTLLRKQASSSELEPRLRGCEPSQSPYPSRMLLHTRKDRCSLDLTPSRFFPYRLASMLPHRLLLWASSLILPDTSNPRSEPILPYHQLLSRVSKTAGYHPLSRQNGTPLRFVPRPRIPMQA